MARYEFKLPDIGEGIAEAEITAWHVKVGDAVAEDQQLADMMTDKATVEMESPVAGTVLEVAGEVGDMIAIGSVLVVIETAGASAADPVADGMAEVPEALDEALSPSGGRDDSLARPGDGPVVAPEEPRSGGGRGGVAGASDDDRRATAATITERLPGSDRRTGDDRRAEERPDTDRRVGEWRAEGDAPAPAPKVKAKAIASPAVRQRARDLGIDLAQVKFAGDRVRHADLDAYLLYQGGGVARGPAPRRQDEAVKVVGLRRKIAENMQEAKRRIPHFTLVEEYDVTALEATRAMMNEDRGANPKLTLLPFLITAMCRTLASYPQMNARYDDEANVVLRSGAVHMGMATQTDNGLSVAVIRNAESREIWDLAADVKRLADVTRAGKAGREELSGSTITISSLGPMGGIASTPVINRPEVAILAVNKVRELPVVIDGELEIRKLMNLSLSCDHRVVDGWDAANFMQDLKALIENPLRLLSSR